MRLNFYKRIAANPEHHGQFLSMMFGKLRNVPDDCSDDRHPHYQQIVNDMKLCEHIDSLHGFVESLVLNPVLAFIKGEANVAFINASFSEIKN